MIYDFNESVNYPTELLNSLGLRSIPQHILGLKVGSPVILLRNSNPSPLFNGTRLVIEKLMNNIIEATILNGKFKCEGVFIVRISMILTDVSIEFQRVQFPIRMTFAMTINKSQGHTISICVLNMGSPCFLHIRCMISRGQAFELICIG